VIQDAHQVISSPLSVSRSSFFPLGKNPLLVRRQRNIVCLMILIKEDGALARSVVSSLNDDQWHNVVCNKKK